MIRNKDLLPACEYCQKTFNDFNQYLEHLNSCVHHFYSCKLCDNKFSDKKKFISHLLILHLDNVIQELNENN